MTDDLKHTTQSIYLKGWYELAKESADEWTLCYQGWVFEVKKDSPLNIMREENIRLTKERDALLDALDADANPNGADFLEWLADRLVNVYGESENVDFVLALRRKAHKQRNAIAKIEGKHD